MVSLWPDLMEKVVPILRDTHSDLITVITSLCSLHVWVSNKLFIKFNCGNIKHASLFMTDNGNKITKIMHLKNDEVKLFFLQSLNSFRIRKAKL